MEKGLHGEHIRFLKSVYGYATGATVIPSYDEKGLGILNWLTQDFFYLDPLEEGTVYVKEYFEMRANAFDGEYTSRQMSEYRLNRKREHAIKEPNSRTAELMGHVDWQRQRFKEINQLLENVVSPSTRGQEYWLQEIYRMLNEGME